MWSEFFYVRLSIWIACGLWFVGAGARIVSAERASSFPEHLYRWSWLSAGFFTWVHVFASYGFVHEWSHESVLKQTGDESFAVVGFRVPWGVYVNFLFAGLLVSYSGWMISAERRAGRLDRLFYLFLAFIVLNALVVFKTGTIRWIGVLGFAILGALHWSNRESKRLKIESHP